MRAVYYHDQPIHQKSEIKCERIIVKGIVQGVGFRPFVYNTACDIGLSGKVANTLEGVEILVQGSESGLSCFKKRLSEDPPKLAQITEIHTESWHIYDLEGFSIETSTDGHSPMTFVPPDAALCDTCQAEMKDPQNRRFSYPFINCTECGPRFSIIKGLPLDRKSTTMDSFPLCQECRNEYESPKNRRFHAQATCCPLCGPKIVLILNDCKKLSGMDAIIKTVLLLKKGKIVAIKGIGGFHLAADATNSEAISRLRRLKERGDKPFAVMAPSIDIIGKFAEVNKGERDALMSSARPVVILKKRHKTEMVYEIAEGVAPSNPLIGVMLPYAPIHLLLFNENLHALVMTSANRKNEPIICKNNDALTALKDMADAVLIHNRDIHIRSDDSVGRWINGSFRLFRRSRGFAPVPVDTMEAGPDIIATGGIIKNTLCFTKGRSAFLSQHIGDLETPAGFEFFHEAAGHMARLFDVKPSVLVIDKHPDYITTKYGQHFPSAKIMTVQHHHAHIVSCMMENGFDSDVIGFAFDGTGYGDDGTIWGGEVLIASRGSYKRAAHVEKVPMPGGSAAVKEPWRMGISWLYHAFAEDMWNMDIPLLNNKGQLFDASALTTITHMMRRKINSPLTSSMGRLFDAVSAIMGLCTVNTFDGQAAMCLEMCALNMPEDMEGYQLEIGDDDEVMLDIEMRPLIRAVVNDMNSGVDLGIISARFHSTLINIFAGIGVRLANRTGIRVAALSGGVFQNARLLSGLSKALKEKNITVLTHSLVPTNDGGLSLGQAGIAAALYRKHKS